MQIVTYNLRFDSKPDNITVQQSIDSLLDPFLQPKFQALTQEQPWSTRRIQVAEELLSSRILIAGFQEALVRQVEDLAELFGPTWSWVSIIRREGRKLIPSQIGVGRDDGVSAGEFSPIFFKNDGVKKRFTLLNTHLDDWSDAQRRLGASMLLARAHFEAVKTKNPVFITGDFNSPSTGSGSGAYSIITGATLPVPINATFAAKYHVDDDQLPNFKLLDLRGEAPRRSVSGNYATFTGFTAPNNTSDWSRIDFIFGGSNKQCSVRTAQGYDTGTSLSDTGLLASDHRPVFADILI
ncbi:hypothetical protein DXG01_014444 [Tephrocybe rancida]|nr:hypothetical protein DXG01_014444 [Tephrocybe rancida]